MIIFLAYFSYYFVFVTYFNIVEVSQVVSFESTSVNNICFSIPIRIIKYNDDHEDVLYFTCKKDFNEFDLYVMKFCHDNNISSTPCKSLWDRVDNRIQKIHRYLEYKDNNNDVFNIKLSYTDDVRLYFNHNPQQFHPEIFNQIDFIVSCFYFCIIHMLYDQYPKCEIQIYNLILENKFPEISKEFSLNSSSSDVLKEAKELFLDIYGCDSRLVNLEQFKGNYCSEIQFYEESLVYKDPSIDLSIDRLELSLSVDRELSIVNTRFLNLLEFIKKNDSHHYLDTKLCIHVFTDLIVNSQCDISIPLSSNDKSVHGLVERMTILDPKCTGSFEQLLPSWKPNYIFINNLDQHYPCFSYQVNDNIKFISTMKLVTISIYDFYTCSNISHMMNAFELFWAIAAAIEYSLKYHPYDSWYNHISGFLFNFFETTKCLHFENLLFSKVMTRAAISWINQYNFTIFVENKTRLDSFINLDFPNSKLSIPSALNIHDNELNTTYQFPILFERIQRDMLTPSGVALMQNMVMKECQSISSNDNVYDINVDPDLLVIATRENNRYFANIDEILAILRKKIDDTKVAKSPSLFSNISSIELVNFGKLQPCYQIKIIQQAKIFIFIHGAEGHLLSFMNPLGLVIEIHPAGTIVNDHNPLEANYYKSDAKAARLNYIYFYNTLPTSYLCKTWEFHVRVAPVCGTIILLDKFHLMINLL